MINNQQASSSTIPTLSNFELKQIVEGLMNHNQEKTLTFEEAQLLAGNKAIEIGKLKILETSGNDGS
jgi:hypothetical protein